jgi:adenine/guanine/hypoxanthine permease
VVTVTGGQRGFHQKEGSILLRAIYRRFDLAGHGTTLRTEGMAGLSNFFTVLYIVAVNAAILADSGIPLEAGILATVLTCFVGCLLMGLWANAPVVLVPGMGVNAFFAYTIVRSMGLSWQEALAAVLLSGLVFAVAAFTRLGGVLSEAVPQSLKEAITVGIGLFLTFIGLQKGGLIAANQTTYVALGQLGSPQALVTLLTLLVVLFLHIRQVRGGFLIGILFGTALAALFGLVDWSGAQQVNYSLAGYAHVLGAVSFAGIGSLAFWAATFSLAMVVVFETMGTLHGFLERPEKTGRGYQASAVSAMLAGVFGTSPTIVAVESAAGLAAGGKTGLTAVTTGVLFLLSLLFLPFIKLIPASAIAPVLIVIGGLMITNVQKIPFHDFSEWFPAFLVIALIPLTYSIADGIAFGFLAYPVLKIALGRSREVATPLFVIAGLFLVTFVLHAVG